MWDPQQYSRYADERSRPFYELVARIGAPRASLVYDLGCGPGELTASLRDRWPEARIIGVDNSPSMLDRASAFAGDEVSFENADLSTFLPPEDADVVISNAAYQWVDNHVDVLREIASRLPAGGWLALQVPGNFDAPSHRIIRGLARSHKWQQRLSEVELRESPVLEPEEYGELFAAAGLLIDTWETTYNQVLPGDDPVLDWVRGTALTPILGVLDEVEQEQFLTDLSPVLRDAYPRRPYGTVFPFRRIFAVGHRPT